MTSMGDAGRIDAGAAPQVVRRVAAALGEVTAAPASEARQLVAHVLDRDPHHLVLAEVDAAAAARLTELVTRRRSGVPLQHLTGRAGFRTVEVAVGPGVFIPRPETEVMVEHALRWLTAHDGTPRVVDLCSGSGAIAAALAAEARPAAEIHAVERSPEAAAYLRRNVAGSGVVVHEVDMADALPELAGRVDLVIANPPYVPVEAWEQVPAEVRDHDPTAAVFSGPDGLDAHRVLTRTAWRLLRPGGLLLAEHAEVQHESIVALYTAAGWAQVRDHRDLTDRWRFLSAIRPRSCGAPPPTVA